MYNNKSNNNNNKIGSITTRRLTIILNLSLKLSSENFRKLFVLNMAKYLTWLYNKLFTVNTYIILELEFGGVGGVLVLFIRFGSTQKQPQKFPQELFMRLICATGSTKKIYNMLVQRRGLIEGYF